jgi:hypothetical protein
VCHSLVSLFWRWPAANKANTEASSSFLPLLSNLRAASKASDTQREEEDRESQELWHHVSKTLPQCPPAAEALVKEVLRLRKWVCSLAIASGEATALVAVLHLDSTGEAPLPPLALQLPEAETEPTTRSSQTETFDWC